METQEMYEYYISNNVSLADVGKKYNLSTSAIRKRFLKAGLKCKGQNSTRQKKIDEKELKRLYCDELLSQTEIAKRLGVAHGTINNRLRKLGLSRSVAESRSLKEDNYNLWDVGAMKEAKKLIETHGSIKRAAEKLGVSENSLQLLNKAKINVPVQTWSKYDEDKVKGLLEEHKDYDVVSRLTNIDKSSIVRKNHYSWRVDLSANCNLFGIRTKGKDGLEYQSKNEASFADRLFDAGVEYEVQARVCDDRLWRCDFKINDTWIELDGLGDFRSQTGDANYTNNDKINYYRKNNFNYIIVNSANREEVLERLGAPKVIKWSKDNIEVREVEYGVANKFCARHHYLGGSPNGDSVRLGFYQNDKLLGVATFGKGANRYLISSVCGQIKYSPISTKTPSGYELTRICILPAVDKNFASHIIGRSIKYLRALGCEIVVTFADPTYKHVGKIYQAANFIYTGMSRPDYCYELPDGSIVHKSKFRSRSSFTERDLVNLAGAKRIILEGKHRYVYVVSKKYKKQILNSLKHSQKDYPC